MAYSILDKNGSIVNTILSDKRLLGFTALAGITPEQVDTMFLEESKI